MKKNILWMMTGLALVSLIAALAFTGCDNGSTSGGLADKAALQTALTAANAAKNGTANSLYWVKTDDLTAFETAITAAKTVYDNADADQAAVDSETNALGTATSTFTAQKGSDGETNPVAALTAIKNAKTGGLTAEVTIIVSGTINYSSGATANGWLDISGSGAYPPIVLQGTAGKGTLNATGSSKGVLFIGNGNTVTLGANLTLKGGSGSSGSGVSVNGFGSTFTMSGGTISGNSANFGGGVSVGSDTTFTMTGGTISGNTSPGAGGGVYVNSAAIFNKTGGTIYGSDAGGGLANNVTIDTYKGYAVFWAPSSGGNKKVDTTLGPTAAGNLSTANATDPLWATP
ncbi:hypothetical protein FACS1894140_3630 [Spirochaetia bacterium]|nr:hypothetical protein FACS1894140_3630 [Spirochaetia bacterium]